MAADLILRAWAIFTLGIVLSEQLPEGSGPISGDTGGYHPSSDDWVKTASNDLHQKKKWSQQHVQSAQTPLSHGVHISEPKKNPVWSPNEYYSRPDAQFGSEDSSRPVSLYATAATETLGTSSDYVGQKEQSSQQPVQFTQTHHGVQMPEPSKRNHALGSEDSRVVSPYVIATAIGTTSSYLNQYEPKHHMPTQTSSSYHFVMNGQHANGSIGSTSGAESRQPSDEQILPSRAEALNLLKQALKDVSRGHPFHSIMQRLIPASSPSWNIGEGEDFPGSVESSPSLPEVQSPFGEGSGSRLSPSVSQGGTLYSGNSIITDADENFGSGKPGSASEPQEPLPDGVLSPSPSVNVYSSGSVSAFSNVESAHKGYSNSARKETPIQQMTNTKAPEGLLQMASASMPHKVNTAIKVTPAQSRIQAYSFYNQKKSGMRKVVPRKRTNSFSVVQMLFPSISKGSPRPKFTASKTSMKRYRITKRPIRFQARYIVKSLNRHEMSKRMFSETSYMPLAFAYTKTFPQVKLPTKSRV